MKRIAVLLLLLIGGGKLAFAQEYDASLQINQIFLNPHILNPAFSGIEKYWQVQTGLRYMSDNYLDQAQGFVSINGSLYNPDIRQNSVRISDPAAYEDQETEEAYRKRLRRHGFGAYLDSDGMGYVANTKGGLTYAYHLPLSRKVNASAGVGLMFNSFWIGAPSYHVRSPKEDEVYQAFINNGEELTKNHLDANLGLAIYTDKMYAGLSAQQLMLANWNSDDAFGRKVAYADYKLQLGYQLPLSADFKMQPSLLVRYNAVQQTQVYGNLKVNYNDVFWLGGGYRNNDAFSAMVGLRAFEKVSISYAWDNPISDMEFEYRGGHEVSIGFTFFNRENHRPYYW